MDKKDGGPAFSGGAYYQHPADGYMRPVAPTNHGMSLRDYFAGQALAGIAGLSGEGFSLSEGDAARWAYQYADAMLAEREDG